MMSIHNAETGECYIMSKGDPNILATLITAQLAEGHSGQISGAAVQHACKLAWAVMSGKPLPVPGGEDAEQQ